MNRTKMLVQDVIPIENCDYMSYEVTDQVHMFKSVFSESNVFPLAVMTDAKGKPIPVSLYGQVIIQTVVLVKGPVNIVQFRHA